jgi:hypothetical protein
MMHLRSHPPATPSSLATLRVDSPELLQTDRIQLSGTRRISCEAIYPRNALALSTIRAVWRRVLHSIEVVPATARRA